MAKAVLITKVSPTYDDLPEERYHFPKMYLRQVEAALNDWIIYYEPRRTTGDLLSTGGRQAYFATARLIEINADPGLGDHSYARVADYLEFDRPVPFKDGEHYYESVLRKHDGTTNKGAFRRAVRIVPDREYDLILQAGFAHVLGERERLRPYPDAPEEPPRLVPELAEEQAPFEPATVQRPLVTQIL